MPLGLQPRFVELDKTAEAYKLEGNKAYKEKDYLSALEKYTQGISECGEDEISLKSDLLRNRSITNLYLQRYETATADALASITEGTDLSLASKKSNAKAYYRAGCALYHREDFKEALGRFRQGLDLLPEDSDCLREIKRTEARLKYVFCPFAIELVHLCAGLTKCSEQTKGMYDFTAISKAASKKHNRLDHASFLPNVEVRQAGSKGRGLFATKDFKAGDLIMCEKAYLVSFSSDSEAETYTVMNLNTNVGVIGTQATLMFNLTQKMLHNPNAAAKYFDLYGGTKQKFTPTQIDGVTVVDTFEIAAIREHNAFGCPSVRSTDIPKDSDVDADPRSASGIWITASYMNHACDGNAARSFIGDLMIIRATKDIAKGAEIMMPYRMADVDPTVNRKALQHGWKFKCECDLCVTEAKAGGSHLSKRRQLVEEIERLMKNNTLTATSRPSKETVAKAQKLYTQIAATYDDKIFKDRPRLGLADLGLWLLNAQPPMANPRNVIDRAVEILRNCGYAVNFVKGGKEVKLDTKNCFLHLATLDAAMHAAAACSFNGQDALGRQFEDFAKKVYEIRMGTLIGFKERYDSEK